VRLRALVVLGVVAGCAEAARPIDLCGRGDEVELDGEVIVAFLDEAGEILTFASVEPDPAARLVLDVPAGAVAIEVEGHDAAGDLVAHGRGAFDDDGACVCIAQGAQYAAACEQIVCQVENEVCRFFDAVSGDANPSRTLVFGENEGDHPGEVADTFIRGVVGQEEQNFAVIPRLEVSAEEVGLVRFDLAALPTASAIEAATLRLVTGNESSEVFQVSRVLEPWLEGAADGAIGCASWTCRVPGIDWTDPGCGTPGSRESPPLAIFEPSTLGPIGVTSDGLAGAVGMWVGDPSTNNGFALHSDGGNGDFASTQGADGDRPRLEVVFTLP
jgi:hypothetical protein